jgi:superfamily II DNA or RNA helicase
MHKLSDLTPEQVEAVDHLYMKDQTLLIAKVGFGKCIVSMTALDELHLDGVLEKQTLVLAPLRVCELTWGTEKDNWDHIRVDVAIATGDAAARSAAVESGAAIVVTNFENAVWMIENYGDRFDSLLIDEISKLKAVGGTVVKKLRKWVRGLKWRCGMSGTPIAEKLEDIYAQALLLDDGAALGTRKAGFKQKYFTPIDYNQHQWEPRPGAVDEIANLLRDLVFVADDAKYWAELPPVVDEIIELVPPDHVRKFYEEMASHSVIEYAGETVAAVNAAVQKGKCHQLANGGVYDDNGDLLFDYTQFKQQALEDVLVEVGGPVMIVYQFTFELAWLRRRFPYAPVLGEGQSCSPELIAEWNQGDHPALIMHPKSAAHGLNLQYGSSTLVHLSPVWGADPWAQCLGRLRRRGTPAGEITRYILVTVETVEEEILARMDEKEENEAVGMKALGR